MLIKIPDWFAGTKRVYSSNCIQIYDENLGEKLGAVSFPSFAKLKKEVREYKFKNLYEYMKAKKKKPHWPRNPDIYYASSGWAGWHDFLGKKKENYLSFKDCRGEVIKKGISSISEYQLKRKSNWPSNPNVYYSKQWKGFHHFFGKKKNNYLSYEECRRQVRKFGIKNMKMYTLSRKTNWPKDLRSTYSGKFKSCYEFFGKERKNFPSFTVLREEVRKYKFKSKVDYSNNIKPNWPASPSQTYPDQFKGWCDFLGKSKVVIRDFLSFEDCRKQVRKMKFKTCLEYGKNRKPNWPANPDRYYEEWRGWGDFLGNEKCFISFEDLRREIKKKNITTQKQYRDSYKKFKGWPAAPNEKYKKQWKNWPHLLGK